MSRPGYASGVTQEGTWNPDGLIAGSATNIVTHKVTVLAGESATNTVRGAVMGVLTANNNQARFAVSTNGDGSETPDCILAHDVDASSGNVDAMVYKAGHYNRNKMVSDASIDLTDDGVIEGLRLKNITMTNAQAAPA